MTVSVFCSEQKDLLQVALSSSYSATMGIQMSVGISLCLSVFLHSVISLTECIGIVRVRKYQVVCLSVCLCVSASMAKLLGWFQWNRAGRFGVLARTDRQTDTQTHRQTDTQVDTHTDRQPGIFGPVLANCQRDREEKRLASVQQTYHVFLRVCILK